MKKPRGLLQNTNVVFWVLALGGVSVAYSIAVWPRTAQASFAGGNGVIAYASSVSFSSVESAIWVVEPTTGNQRQLTAGPQDFEPAFSASGNQLLFVRGRGTSATVEVAADDGTNAIALAQGTEPTFSPDGHSIAFVRPGGIFVASLRAGRQVGRIVQITHVPGDLEPTWGPRHVLAFERATSHHIVVEGTMKRQFTNALVLIQPTGGHMRTIVTYEQSPYARGSERPTLLHPDWSPSGSAISVSFCGPLSLPARIPTVPAVLANDGCGKRIWAPSGSGLISPKEGVLQGRQETNCPHVIGSDTEIAWQPIRPGTTRVQTVACESRPGDFDRVTEPSESVRGSRTCYTLHHRRRCHAAGVPVRQPGRQ